jgi:hypothetical protein
MTVNAVESYVVSLLDGIQSPNMPAPTQAWVMPPPVLQLTPNPQVFVWGGTWNEERHTIPRGKGEKRATYALSIWIQSATTNDPSDEYGPAAFPILIETLLDILRTVTIPIWITDPVTGAETTIQTIGEKMQVTHPTPIADADQRFLWHTATVKATVTEEFTG